MGSNLELLDKFNVSNTTKLSITDELGDEIVEILNTESHHGHEIVNVDNTLRWKSVENATAQALLDIAGFDKGVEILLNNGLINNFIYKSLILSKNIEIFNKYANLLNLNLIMQLFFEYGFDKNSEEMRRMYRGLGSSLFAYWELFYWDMNNAYAHLYKPNTKIYEA